MRIMVTTTATVALAIILSAPAAAGPCVPDLPCVPKGSTPPAVKACQLAASPRKCDLFTPGWTCDVDVEDPNPVVEESNCHSVWYSHCARRARRANWVNGHWVILRKPNNRQKCESNI